MSWLVFDWIIIVGYYDDKLLQHENDHREMRDEERKEAQKGKGSKEDKERDANANADKRDGYYDEQTNNAADQTEANRQKGLDREKGLKWKKKKKKKK